MGIIDKLIEQSPMAAALIALVIIFIRYIKFRDASTSATISKIVERHDQRVEDLSSGFKEYSRNYLDIQERTLKSTEKNSVLIDQVGTICNRLNDSITSCQNAQIYWKKEAELKGRDVADRDPK